MTRCSLLAAVLLAAALALPALAIAQDAPPGARAPAAEEWHYDAWNSLMSPYCPGRTLMDCPSGQAAELREWIAEQEAAGRDRADVEAELYGEFGDVILQAPKAQGFGLAAYVIPVVGVLVGAMVVVLFLRRQAARRAREAPLAPAPERALDPELERRIDEEMRGGLRP